MSKDNSPSVDEILGAGDLGPGGSIYDEGYRDGQCALAEKLLAGVSENWGKPLIPEWVRGACAAVLDGESVLPMKSRPEGPSPLETVGSPLSEVADAIPEEDLAEPNEGNAASEGAPAEELLSSDPGAKSADPFGEEDESQEE